MGARGGDGGCGGCWDGERQRHPPDNRPECLALSGSSESSSESRSGCPASAGAAAAIRLAVILLAAVVLWEVLQTPKRTRRVSGWHRIGGRVVCLLPLLPTAAWFLDACLGRRVNVAESDVCG